MMKAHPLHRRRSLRKRYGHAQKAKFHKDDEVKFTWAGSRFNQTATVEYVRRDGALVVHFDSDPPDALTVVQAYEVAK
jgi:hypothetical protein